MSTQAKRSNPARGEVWMVDLDPTKGHEQTGRRPALVISANDFNNGPRGLVVVLPITGTDRGLSIHVPVAPPQGGLAKPSVVMTEQIRSISKSRFVKNLGAVEAKVLDHVEQNLRFLLAM
jgi:mRNA interferase MazF